MALENKLLNKGVLILGSPRSGTTWLAKLFDSNENVLYRHEPDSIIHAENLPFIPPQDCAEELLVEARSYLEQMASNRDAKVSGILPVFAKSYRSRLAGRFRELYIMAVKALDTAGRKVGFKGEFSIPDMISSKRANGIVTVIKSVNSLARAKMFSDASTDFKIVHIIRHPCAFVASELRGFDLKLMSVETYIETLAEMPQAARRGLRLAEMEEFSLEEQLACLWMLQNEKVIEEMEGREDYKLVVYEDLCNDPARTMEDLLNHAGLVLTEQTRTFIEHSNSSEGGEEKYFQIVRDSKKASQKWRDELNEEQIHSIASLVSDSAPGRLFFNRPPPGTNDC